MNIQLPPISQTRSLTHEAYNHIKTFILTNALKPGQQLKEEWLASQLQISATPVREALAQLAQEKLVEIIPHRGKFVATITAQDVKDIYEVRCELEGLAIALATPQIPQADLEDLERYFRTAEGQIRQNNYEIYFEGDSRLHSLTLDYAKNQWLRQMLGTLNDHVRRIRAFSLAYSGPHIQQSLQEHFAILAAIKNRDAALAQNLMEQHVRQAGQRIIKIIEALESDSL